MTSKPPKRWLAALLALAAPGAGHLYAGTPYRALVLACAITSLSVVSLTLSVVGPIGPAAMLAGILGPLALWAWSAWDAWRQASRWTTDRPRPAYTRWFVLAPVIIALWVTNDTIRNAFRAGRVQAFRIPTGAMEPTVQIGDFLMVDKRSAARQLQRGEIYVFLSTEEPELHVIKRAMALAGDTVAMRAGILLVNGQPLAEAYLHPQRGVRHEDELMRTKMREWQASYAASADTTYNPDLNDWGPLVVPAASFLALGDNRDASYDSRYYGFVPDSLVVGRPLYIYFSRDPNGTLRWDRIGRWVR